MKWTFVVLSAAAVYLQLLVARVSGSGQTISLPLVGKRQPMYLTESNVLWPINQHGQMVFKNYDRIKLYCESEFLYPANIGKTLTLTYNNGAFRVANDPYKLNELICAGSRTVEAKLVEQSNECIGYKLYNIGYDIPGGFVTIYQICFDSSAQIAKYAKHILRPGAFHNKRIDWDLTDIGTFGYFSNFYKKLPSSMNSGLLAPVGDFFYAAEQRAAFIYPNAAPQTKDFDCGEWSYIEKWIRSEQHDRTFECYTGVLGVMLVEEETRKTELYLDAHHAKIPAPKYFFKIVYEPDTELAIVFVGLNQRSGIRRPNHICTNVIEKFSSARPPTTETLIVCDYEDFRRHVVNAMYLPNLDVDGLLFATYA